MENIMRAMETFKEQQEIGLDYTHQLEVQTNIQFDKDCYEARIVSIHEGSGKRYETPLCVAAMTLMDAMSKLDDMCHEWLVARDRESEQAQFLNQFT